MPKYEELVKEKNKGSIRIDELAKKYKMSVIDVKNVRQMVHDAELETSLVKAVGMNSPEMKAAKARISQLEEDLHSKDYWRDPDYKFLIEENAELQKRIIELEQEVLEVKVDNKKLAQQITTMMERMRDTEF